MIECCSQELTENFISEIKGANMSAIMADEARDGKTTEQLALCVRYVSAESAVKERFLDFTEVSQFDATSITAATENQLVKKGSDYLKCVAQTYDGAAVMSGDVECLGSRTKAMSEANQIAVSESSLGQWRKTKRMDEYVVESTCGAGSETCGSSESDNLLVWTE